ncbi:MAG: AAA family ATPase [Parcubacteria group bacterium]|nr:AAA family ATPase [Parcubacteria group bacterium]
MKAKEVSAFLKSIVRYPEAPAVFIWGPPGVGKSDVARQVAEEENIGFADLRLALMDPTDLRGIPVPEDGKAKWLPPQALPTEGEGILFLDELNLAPPLVQSSAYQMVLDRKLGEYELPKGWRVIAAGNKTEHGANTYKMAPPLRNRFTHIDFGVDVDDWREWAIKNDVKSEVVEFITFRPDLLFQFDPKRYENAFPTPRSWEFVSNILKSKNGLSEEIVHKVIEGTVGAGAAAEFKGYMAIRETLPAVDDILGGKDFVPGQTDVACAFVTALVIRANSRQYDRVLEYSEKLPAEVSVLLGKLLVLKDKEGVLSCSAWAAWSKKHYALIT